MHKILIITALLAVPAFALFSQSSVTDTIDIEEVAINGTKTDVARKYVPLTLSKISGEVFQQASESALMPVLSEEVPGLFVTERGIAGFGVATGAAGQLNMRGIRGNFTTQILILLNGHPQFMGIMVYEVMNLFHGNTLTLGLDYMNSGGKGNPVVAALRNDDGTVILSPTFELTPMNDTWIEMNSTGLYATVRQQVMNQLTLNGHFQYECTSLTES